MSVPNDLQTSVEQVAKILEGKSVALIGGDPRADAARRIKEAFRLKDVVWKSDGFTFDKDECEGLVSRDNVAVVVLLVRWSRFEFRTDRSNLSETRQTIDSSPRWIQPAPNRRTISPAF